MAKAQPQVETSDQAEAVSTLVESGLVKLDGQNYVEIRSATNSELSNVQSFEDAVRLAQDLYGEIIPSYDLGDGFTGLDDKDELVGVPFIVMGWGLGWSDFGDDERFSILRVVTQDGRKLRFSDGGSGVHRTLVERFQGDPINFTALMALGGLSRGEYKPRNADGSDVLDGKGNVVNKAVTYRFDVDRLSLKV